MIITQNNQIHELAKNNKIASFPLLKPNRSLFSSAIRSLYAKLRFNNLWFYNFKNIKDVSDDWIIVFDASVSVHYLKKLKNLFPTKRIIFWYWNDVKYAIHPSKIPEGIEVWSYSEQDCKKFNLKHNTQFILNFDLPSQKQPNVTTDIYYIGRDKNRLKDLIYYRDQFQKTGLNVDFHIVPNRNHSILKNKNCRPAIPYSQVISNIEKSKAIFDFYEDPYMGLSLRPLEALQFQKKLITNNKNITNYDFYNPNNIFVIGKDNLNSISDFLSSPFVDTSDMVHNYCFDRWIDRFKLKK